MSVRLNGARLPELEHRDSLKNLNAKKRVKRFRIGFTYSKIESVEHNGAASIRSDRQCGGAC